MKKFVIIVIFSLIVLLTYDFVSTYSLFESDITVPSEIALAKWEISVNDSKIGESDTFVVENVIWDENDNVLGGKAAPGGTASFDINIKPNDTGVAFRYDITLDYTNMENEAIKLSSIEDTNGNSLVKTGPDTYSSIVSIDDIKNGVDTNIKVSLIWENIETNNEVDSSFSKPDTYISIPVTVNFSQYLGEELVEYTE